jgi:hypothetical protein
MLDILKLYCAKWQMLVNVDKTVVVIFNLHSSIPRQSFSFFFDGCPLLIVEQFRYLGLVFHQSGSWAQMILSRVAAARCAFAVWRRRFATWVLTPRVVERLFKTCVMPVLDY